MRDEMRSERRPALSVSATDRTVGGSTDKKSRIPVVIAVLVVVSILGGVGYGLFHNAARQKAVFPARDRIVAVFPQSRLVTQRLVDEPCDRSNFAMLVQFYYRGQEYRALTREVAEFEKECGAFPQVRLLEFQSYMLLSEFNIALSVSDALVAEYNVDWNAWAARAEAKEALGDLEGASNDLRQALALFPDPSTVAASAWYRLTKVLEGLGRYCEAAVPLQVFISFNPLERRTQQITTLLSDLRRKGDCGAGSDEAKVTLRFGQTDSALIANVKVNGVEGRFVVDTGASTVVVTDDFALKAQIAVNSEKSITLSTANGRVVARTGYANRISVQGLVAERVFVSVVGGGAYSLGADVDGLLGLTFLGNFEFHLADRVLTLSKLPQ